MIVVVQARYYSMLDPTQCTYMKQLSPVPTIASLLQCIILLLLLLFVFFLRPVRSTSANPTTGYVSIDFYKTWPVFPRPVFPVSALIPVWGSNTATRGAASAARRWDVAVNVETAGGAAAGARAGARTSTGGGAGVLTLMVLVSLAVPVPVPRSFSGPFSTTISRFLAFPVPFSRLFSITA